MTHRRLPVILVLLAISAAQGWKLVWSDEFGYSGLPDSGKWGYEEGRVRNGEAQYYTSARAENARVENGHLVIEARKESYRGADYTSASLITRGRSAWTYGRMEVRAKLPSGRGTWPAIWTLGTDISRVGWPACGEMDILENVGFDPDRVHANIHTQAYNHVKGTGKGASVTLAASPPYETFHVYALEWFEGRLDFYVDTTRYFTFANEGGGNEVWPYDKPHYLILNLAIGGSWGGQQGIDDSRFPHRFLVDYVRVYEQGPDPSASLGPRPGRAARILPRTAFPRAAGMIFAPPAAGEGRYLYDSAGRFLGANGTPALPPRLFLMGNGD